MPIRKVAAGNLKWMLDLRYVGGGRPHFETRDQAMEVRSAKLLELQKYGSSSLALSDQDRLEFIRAKKRLDQLKTTLTGVLEFYEKHHRAAVEMSLEEAVLKIYDIKTLTNKRGRSSENFRYTLQSLARSAPGRMIYDIAREDVEAWLYGNGWGPATIRTKLIDVQTFFRAALSRGWVTINPADGIERVHLDDKPPGILSVAEVAKLMGATLAVEPDFCGFMALAIFCGIRPEELEGMTMKDVQAARGFVEVPAEVAKSRQRRLVDLSENCKAWLKCGLVLPPVNSRGRLNKVRIKAGFEGYRKERVEGREKWIKVSGREWPHDAMRHSYASYHLAQHGTAEKTALQMGHRSSEMLFRHYRELVPPEEAEKFWKIKP